MTPEDKQRLYEGEEKARQEAREHRRENKRVKNVMALVSSIVCTILGEGIGGWLGFTVATILIVSGLVVINKTSFDNRKNYFSRWEPRIGLLSFVLACLALINFIYFLVNLALYPNMAYWFFSPNDIAALFAFIAIGLGFASGPSPFGRFGRVCGLVILVLYFLFPAPRWD